MNNKRSAQHAPLPRQLTYRDDVGSRQLNLGSRIAAGATAMVFGALTLVGCNSEPAAERATVTTESAYIAIVQWEVGQTEPVIDEEGNVEPPVIYLASVLGGTIDVGVQAGVVATIHDTAVIRFADDPRDARDQGLEGEPVKDEGVMLVFDEFEPDQPVIEARISRYRSVDDVASWRLEVTAGDDGDMVTSAATVDPTDD
jgi:hypothetical protein